MKLTLSKILIVITLFSLLFLYRFEITEPENTNETATQTGSVLVNGQTLNAGDFTYLDVPYINQFLDASGNPSPDLYTPSGKRIGNISCGATSAVMIMAYYNKLRFNDYNDLKEYTYKDKGQGLNSYCSDLGIYGAFGVTSKGADCAWNTDAGIREYFKKLDFKAEYYYSNLDFNTIKTNIDSSNPIMIAFCGDHISCHIAVVTGYDENGNMLVNDPWRNLSLSGSSWSMNGHKAVYPIELGTMSKNLEYTMFVTFSK
jgi:Peptidase_C39 like family